MRLIAWTIGLALVAGPALAEETAADKEAEKDKMICKRERQTGSRIATDVCMTAREWEERTEASRRSREGAAHGRSLGDPNYRPSIGR